MNSFEKLKIATSEDQKALLEIDFVKRGIAGDWSREEYLHFLTQAYHHVKHTMPLLMYSGSKFSFENEWLRDVMVEYIEEEHGHQIWILNDIEAIGGDREAVFNSQPGMACDLLVSYAYDMITRKSPLGFLGMVHVLEGTSIRAATTAAENIQKKLNLPDKAFSYLNSHGSLDIKHVNFFEGIVNRVKCEKELNLIIHAAKTFFKLYGDIFREAQNKFAGDKG